MIVLAVFGIMVFCVVGVVAWIEWRLSKIQKAAEQIVQELRKGRA